MEGYWPTIPPKPPPNDNIRTFAYSSKDRNAKQHNETLQQQILKKMIFDIQCMCKRLDKYMEES